LLHSHWLNRERPAEGPEGEKTMAKPGCYPQQCFSAARRSLNPTARKLASCPDVQRHSKNFAGAPRTSLCLWFGCTLIVKEPRKQSLASSGSGFCSCNEDRRFRFAWTPEGRSKTARIQLSKKKPRCIFEYLGCEQDWALRIA